MAIVARNIYDPYVAPFDGAPGDGIVCTVKEGKTVQSDSPSCDINRIMERFQKTGVLPDMIKINPQYGDFSTVPDFQEALNIVNMAKTQFNALDPKVRLRFGNDPAEFLEFVSNPDNRKELVSMGLAFDKPAEEPVSTPPASGTPEGGSAPTA